LEETIKKKKYVIVCTGSMNEKKRRRMRFGNEGERIFTFTAACSFFFGCSHFSFYGSDHEQFKHSE
jgi:hypothetical protein